MNLIVVQNALPACLCFPLRRVQVSRSDGPWSSTHRMVGFFRRFALLPRAPLHVYVVSVCVPLLLTSARRDRLVGAGGLGFAVIGPRQLPPGHITPLGRRHRPHLGYTRHTVISIVEAPGPHSLYAPVGSTLLLRASGLIKQTPARRSRSCADVRTAGEDLPRHMTKTVASPQHRGTSLCCLCEGLITGSLLMRGQLVSRTGKIPGTIWSFRLCTPYLSVKLWRGALLHDHEGFG